VEVLGLKGVEIVELLFYLTCVVFTSSEGFLPVALVEVVVVVRREGAGSRGGVPVLYLGGGLVVVVTLDADPGFER